MTPQELKNSVLQMAIQGKLVEQRPEEGTGEELYQQIQAEKQRLIKAGKLKKEKPLPEITEDEIPFDIPESWKWVRLRSIVFNRGQVIPQSTFSYIDIGSIDNKKQCLNSEENLIEANKAPSRARKIVEYGDILYSTVRPYLHNMCIINREFSCTPIASTGFAAMTCHCGVYNKFLFYYLMSSAFDSYANNTENSKGVAYPAINDDRLYRAIIALPPLAEQRRIVAKIEELLPYIDRYEQAWSKLEDLNKRFPIDLQNSILQMAIQGKLVEQRPEEGTAEELYQQIQAEKQRLIKAGTIKKEKPMPEIAEDEKPFDIPESWKWVRLNSLTLFIKAGGDKPKDFSEVKTKTHTVPVIANGIQNDGIIGYTQVASVDEPCITVSGRGTIGFSCIRTEPFCPIVRLLVLNIFREVLQEYIQIVLTALLERGVGTSIQQLTVPMLEPKLIPIPPMEEQKRIVAKLDEILHLCEKLK